MLAAGNWIAFWGHERIGVKVQSGVDEIALAFIADAYSRSYKSQAITVAQRPGPLRTKRGLYLLPDQVGDALKIDHFAPSPPPTEPVHALDEVLRDIRCRYGERVSSFIALQLEYPSRRADQEDGESPAEQMICIRKMEQKDNSTSE